MATAGAKVSDDGIIETFDNDDQALDAADNGVAVSVFRTIFQFLHSFWVGYLCFCMLENLVIDKDVELQDL